MSDKNDMDEFDNAPDLTPEELASMEGVSNLSSDAQKWISEAFEHENINVMDNKPSYISITSWFVMHECRHFGEPGQDIVADIYEAAVMHYNPFDPDDTSEVLGFDGPDAQKWQSTIKGLCGGDHYRLVNDQYEPYDPDMVGGYDISSPEKIKEAVSDTIERLNRKNAPQPELSGTALYIQHTLENLKSAAQYMKEHKSRFKLVLSSEKSDDLENAFEQTQWTLIHATKNSKESTFLKMPQEQQEEQLDRLNKTLAFVLEGSDVSGRDKEIHQRCRSLYKGIKNFQNNLA